MLKAGLIVAALVLAALPCARLASAQTSPTPGPTNPTPPPGLKPGSDLVINPTIDECDKGWRPDLKWTRDEFDAFCTQLKTSK